jgi:hypothetical protein
MTGVSTLVMTMSGRVDPLTDDEIRWVPFVRVLTPIQDRELFLSGLLGLTHAELREYCTSIWEDRRAVTEALHEATLMLAGLTKEELDRLVARIQRRRECQEGMPAPAAALDGEATA